MSDPASIYEGWFVPAVFAPLAREILATTDLLPGARVLDVACGSGIVARLAASRVGPTGSVTGLDLSPTLLAAARRAAESEGLSIAWREGSALDLPFPAASFDVVFCQMGLQFFPDRPRGVEEMFRVLAPGGRVVVSTWQGLDQHPFSVTIERAMRRHLNAPGVEMAFSLGDPVALAALLQEAGFSDVSVEPVTIEASYSQPERYIELRIAASSAAVPALQALSAAERQALIDGIREETAEPVRAATVGDRLRFPMHAIVARGRRG